MPAVEITEWQAYEQVTGRLGAERADMLSAVVAATVANSTPGRKRRLRLADFLPRWDRPPETDWRATRAAFLATFGIKQRGG